MVQPMSPGFASLTLLVAAVTLLLLSCASARADKEVVAKLVVEEDVFQLSQLMLDPTAPVEIFDGEDAASAAQRLMEASGMYDAEVTLALAKGLAEPLQGADYSPPKELKQKTGGAYSRRADEAIKNRHFREAVADCVRALMRPGLDSTAADVFMKKLEHALLRMERIKEMQDMEAMENAGKYAEEEAEAEKLAKEWAATLAEDEAAWQTVDKWTVTGSEKDGGSSASGAAEEVVGMDLTLTSTGGKKKGSESSHRMSLREGEDVSHAVFHFCANNDLHNTENVKSLHSDMSKKVAQSDYTSPAHLKIGSAAEHLEKGKAHAALFDFSAAGSEYARGLHSKTIAPEEQTELETRLSEALGVLTKVQQFSEAWREQNCTKTLEAAADIPAALRTDTVQMMISRCYSKSGKTKEAISSLTGLLNRCDKSGSWLNNEPRLMAAISAAILALRVGDVEKAKKMYQVVLRNDPDQEFVKKRYKPLRTYMQMLKNTDELLKSSKNHDVLKAIERSKGVLEKVMGKEAAQAASTRLLLFECNAKSAMTFHDDAIEACNTAIEQFENHDNPDPRLIAEAYAWRAQANVRDKSYEDAVADLQVALKKDPNSRAYEEKLQEAKKLQDDWNKSEEQHDRRGQKQGHFYSNRPNKEILDLPDNVDELDQEQKCSRLKLAFRKMSLRWHPDKAKGGKRRAQRKSAELGEAKGLLELQWQCKGRR